MYVKGAEVVCIGICACVGSLCCVSSHATQHTKPITLEGRSEGIIY